MSNKPVIEGGFVLFAKKTLESGLMRMNPLTFKLFAWMLLRASYTDGEKLKRGQLFTTIEEMREVGSYMAGYRKIKPSKRKVRTSYETLTKSTMIDTTKSTRGLIITVLNYDKYQSVSNYERHTEGHNEMLTKVTSPAHYSKEAKERRKKSFSSDSAEVRLSQLLLDLIRQRNPEHKSPDIEAWAKHVDLMIRLDRRHPEKIEQVIRWSQADAFWSKNILSPAKLREKFDQLVLQTGKPTSVRNHLAAV